MIAVPRRARSGHQAVDLHPRADIHAPGGFVEDEDPRTGGQPLGKHQLLLRAAGKRERRLGKRFTPDSEFPGVIGRDVVLPRMIDPRARPGVFQRDQSHVVLRLHLQDQTLLQAVFRQQADPVGDPVIRRADHDRLAVDEYGAALRRDPRRTTRAKAPFHPLRATR